MSWERSDKFALAAIIISLISLSISGIFSFISFQEQYGEDLAIESLDFGQDYVHVFSLARSKETGPLVNQIAMWYKLRIINNSNNPITVVDARYQEDNNTIVDIPEPFFSDVEYKGYDVKLRNSLSLPMRIEPGDVKEIFALLPTSVSESMGKLLLKILRINDIDYNTLVEKFLFIDNFFDTYQKEVLSDIKKRELSKYFNILDLNIDNLEFTRGLLQKTDNKVIFLDYQSDADDGFIFKEALSLHNEVIDSMLVSKNLTFQMLEPNFDEYKILLQTSSGKGYKLILKRPNLFFERYE